MAIETKLEGVLVTATDSLKKRVLILINEQEISALQGLRTIIKNNDRIIFIPVSHGG